MTRTVLSTLQTPPETDLDPGAPLEAFWCTIEVGEEAVSRGVPHVNNAEYVRFVDRIAELATDEAGFTREAMLADQHMWFVARHEIDYRAEAFVGDHLVAATWIRDWTRTTVTRETRILRPSDGKLVIVASTRWAFVDLQTRRPARIPPSMREAFPRSSGATPP